MSRRKGNVSDIKKQTCNRRQSIASPSMSPFHNGNTCLYHHTADFLICQWSYSNLWNLCRSPRGFYFFFLPAALTGMCYIPVFSVQLQGRSSGESPCKRASFVGKWNEPLSKMVQLATPKVFTFAVPPPEAQRARAGTEVAEKFFEKVRSSLDGQGKCVKIFLGNGGEY